MKSPSELSSEEKQKIEEAKSKAYILYEGVEVPHRSCGIALAETFNLATTPYQCLRKGGITGKGECGAIKAGELILGEYLGDPDPTGVVTQELREAATLYRELWEERVDRGQKDPSAPINIVCDNLTQPFEDFMGKDRQQFCTNIASTIAEIVAEILCRLETDFKISPIESAK